MRDARIVAARRGSRRKVELIVRLADGSLPERQQRFALSLLEGSPEAARHVERQRRVATALRAGGPRTSPRARQLIPTEARSARSRKPSSTIRARPRRSALALTCTAVIALSAITLLTVNGRGGASAPTVSQTALLAFRQPTAAPPTSDSADPAQFSAELGGVSFPDYQRQFGVRASGQRTDVSGGRPIRTVYYTLPSGGRVSYSIVSGAALSLPAPAHLVTVSGVLLRTYVERGLTVVTLVRHGRTCVLVGNPATMVLALAVAPLLGSPTPRS